MALVALWPGDLRGSYLGEALADISDSLFPFTSATGLGVYCVVFITKCENMSTSWLQIPLSQNLHGLTCLWPSCTDYAFSPVLCLPPPPPASDTHSWPWEGGNIPHGVNDLRHHIPHNTDVTNLHDIM